MGAQVSLVSFDERGSISVGQVHAESMLDPLNIDQFTQEVLAYLRGRRRANLLLDFGEVQHMSSTIFTELLKIRQAVEEDRGHLRLCALNPSAREIISLTELKKPFVIYDSASDAPSRFERALQTAAQEGSWPYTGVPAPRLSGMTQPAAGQEAAQQPPAAPALQENLARMIYVSRMTEACSTKELQAILDISRKKNEAMGITGVLCYDPAFFMQCIEGPRRAVNDLYSSILRDDRHRDVIVLEDCEVRKRIFGEWSMACIAARDVGRGLLNQYTGSGRFDPYGLTGAQACSFLIEMVSQNRARLGAA